MRKQYLIYILSFVLIIVLGVLYNYGINKEKESVATRKRHEQLLYEVDFDKVEENVDTNFLKDGETEIIKRLDAFKKGELVGIIYVGLGEGRNGTMEIAFGVNVDTDAIVGMLILESEETPQYQAILTENEKFVNQFHNKDMSDKSFVVEATTGATMTGDAINDVMQLVRAQYENDTDFEAPVGLQLVSKVQDFETLNFVYEFLTVEEDTLTVMVNFDYEILEISNDEYEETAQAAINENKFEAYISEIDENTITIISKGFAGELVTIAEITDGSITSFETDLDAETYDHDYNSLYEGGNFEDAFSQIVDGEAIEAITGATVTLDGVKAAHEILRNYLEEVSE